MAKPTLSPRPASPCNNCGRPVQPRRPSKHGVHFCSTPICQSAKVRFYRTKQVESASAAAGTQLEQWTQIANNVTALLGSVIADARVTCPACGLIDAIEGFPHFGADADRCFGTGGAGVVLTRAAVETVWPAESRRYAAVS